MVQQDTQQPSLLKSTGSHQQTQFGSHAKHQLATWWHRSQIGHRTEYSVERLLSFRDCYQRTSVARAVAVCILSPLPAVLVALVIDCIPLRPPSEGWQANYAVWIRLLLAIFVEALGVALQLRAVIIPGAISNFGAAKIALSTTVSSVLATMLLAALWKFPIPCGYVLMLNLYVTFLIIYMILVIGPRLLTQSAMLRQQIKSELLIMASQGAVAVLYPAFSAVFNRLSGVEQAMFVLVMPMIKFLTKQSIAHVSGSFYEYVGPILVFSVDLFNVYYVAICMQTSKSMVTTSIIMAMDGLHIFLALRAIFYSPQRRQAIAPIDPDIDHLKHYLRDLPSQLRKVFREVDPSHPCRRRIRLLAPFPLPLSTESVNFMNDLARTGSFANDTTRCSMNSVITRSQVGPSSLRDLKPRELTRQQSSVVPSEMKVPRGVPTLRDTSRRSISVTDLTKLVSFEVSEDAILHALQTLFHSEYVLLAEYIEFMVPTLYSLYLSVLFHLPVAAYYPHTASMTVDRLKATVTNIMVYAAMEWISFGLLLVLLKRKFGFSPLYQLAFVLEAQASAIQGHLFLWTITILHITLVHYGADFIVRTT